MPLTFSRMHLSVVVITRNEIANIDRCLNSVAFADEVIVLDSGSTDGTIERAREMGAVVIESATWPGFGPQKNLALSHAQSDWVLSLDADEWLTPELAHEIRSLISQPEQHGSKAVYEMPRRSSYCGQYMNHGGWYPDRVPRLFPNGTARYSEDLVHERLLHSLPVRRLKSDLMHRSISDFESMLDKLNRYSTGRAKVMHQQGAKGGLGAAVGHGLWTFIRCYVLRRGFLDGTMGFVLAVSNAEGAYYRYLKIWLLERGAQERRQSSE